jgi:hypothetical protein
MTVREAIIMSYHPLPSMKFSLMYNKEYWVWLSRCFMVSDLSLLSQIMALRDQKK